MHQLYVQFINYVWYLLHVSALHSHLQGVFLVPSERAVDGMLWMGVLCLVMWCARTTSLDSMPIHNIPSAAPQLSISQKALGTLPDDGNVMPKHVGATIHN
jgi:hypothetical protein